MLFRSRGWNRATVKEILKGLQGAVQVTIIKMSKDGPRARLLSILEPFHFQKEFQCSVEGYK